jgi:hypothetical protein
MFFSPSEVVNDVANSEIQRLSDSPQRFDGDFFLRALDLPDVVAIEVSFLRQLFLAEFCFFALGTDSLAQNAIKFF